MNLLSWNCRGIGNAPTVQELRELADKFAPKVLCIMETQINGVRAGNLKSNLGYDNSFVVDSSGRSGGLAIFWNNEIKIEVLGYSKYHIDGKISGLGEQSWRLSCFYGEARTHLRQHTWDTMKILSTLQDMSWVCLGDFNEVLKHDEHDGIGSRSQSQIQGFRDAVDVCGLVDLGFKGTRWTYEKRVEGGSYTRVRLDRALGSVDWCGLFPAASVEHLTAATSDHSPVLLQLSHPNGGKKKKNQFRYEVMWDTHPELKSTIQSAWESNSHNLMCMKCVLISRH
ncbi:uncharacterized protein [Aegilops tauschii subsp. strangulata]|uniref:uncharacterized protein n=1 Tax=Aegilops tauschii subsp. strangulata TaxID=200361 RepID=UPI003CC8CFF2